MVATISSVAGPQARVEIPPPPAPDNGYVRCAVVQLEFHPCAVIEQFHLLEQPVINGRSPNWFGTAQTSDLRRVRSWERQIGQQIRAIYVEQETSRLAEILAAMARWHVDIVIFPEYSVAPECLEHLVPMTKNMVVVFGTHSVESRLVDAGLYTSLGVSNPDCGTAVAPVAVDGVLKYLQPKLNKTHLESGLMLGGHWASVDIPRVADRRMGILVCLDFLRREATPYRTHVGAKIDECHLLAVPSLTPDYTVERFEARALDENKGYGRSVLYADISSGGGSSIFVDSALDRPTGIFPFGVPGLARGEEGAVVVDIDVDYTYSAEKASRRYADRTAAVPVAASTFRYPLANGDLDYISTLTAIFQRCDMGSRGSLAPAIRSGTADLERLADHASPTVQQRLNGLVEHYGQARNAEEILCRLRDIELSDNVLPFPALQELRVRTARDAARILTPSRAEEAAVAVLRQRLAALCTEDT